LHLEVAQLHAIRSTIAGRECRRQAAAQDRALVRGLELPGDTANLAGALRGYLA
jgi:hypothetical protein